MDGLIEQYLNLNTNNYLILNGVATEKTKQMKLFETSEKQNDEELYKNIFYVYIIYELSKIIT